MDYKKKYKNALGMAEEIIRYYKEHNRGDEAAIDDLKGIFPELKESEDEKIRKWLLDTITQIPNDSIEWEVINKADILAWLEKQGEKSLTVDIKSMVKSYKQRVLEQSNNMESPLVNICVESFRHGIESTLDELNLKNLEKQGEQKPIMNVPTREVILAIWDLGNEWKELTNGSISTEYGTQLDYIQKHWHESEYYLREKQDEKKVTTIDFNAKDWYVSKVDGKIHNINISSEKQGEKKPTEWSEDDERIVTALMEGFRYHQLFNPRFGEVPNAEIISWIKSLKERLS